MALGRRLRVIPTTTQRKQDLHSAKPSAQSETALPLRADAPITFTLASGQVLAVSLSAAAETRVLAELVATMAAASVIAKADEEVKCRTYHLGSKPTTGRGYDDRLVMRMGFSDSKIRQLLVAGPIRGGIRHRRVGSKYIVSEAAVREWFGD